MNTDDTSCSICMEELCEDENLIITVCEHRFHSRCLDRWALVGRNNCPLCRCSRPMDGGVAVINNINYNICIGDNGDMTDNSAMSDNSAMADNSAMFNNYNINNIDNMIYDTYSFYINTSTVMVGDEGEG